MAAGLTDIEARTAIPEPMSIGFSMASVSHPTHRTSFTIGVAINTDVGIFDDNTNLVPALESALADLLIASASP